MSNNRGLKVNSYFPVFIFLVPFFGATELQVTGQTLVPITLVSTIVGATWLLATKANKIVFKLSALEKLHKKEGLKIIKLLKIIKILLRESNLEKEKIASLLDELDTLEEVDN